MSSLPAPRRWAYRAYRSLPGPVHRLGETALRIRAEREVAAQPWFGDAPVRLLVGPLNTAGQAWQWARAADALPGTSALALRAVPRYGAGSLRYDADVTLDGPAQLRGLARHRARVLAGAAPATHVLAESARPVLQDFHTAGIEDDLSALRAAGAEPAVVLHGSEIRDLRRHAERDPSSPFRGEWTDRWSRLQSLAERTRGRLASLDLPVFVSTPDLLEDLPDATWLPVVVDVDRFATDAPVMEQARPVVLHAPSNPLLKGTAQIEEVVDRLGGEGLIAYRRLTGVPHQEMSAAVAAADVVVDQVVLGNPGVLLAESLAAGRVVVAHLPAEVRRRLREADTEGEDAPVLEAGPDTLEQVLRGLVAGRTDAVALAARGPAWARRNHDGTRAAAVLAPFLTGGTDG